MKAESIVINDEKVYLRKDWLGWHVVYPIRNEDGSWNWFNFLFGGKANLITLIIILVLAAFLLFGVSTMFASCRDLATNMGSYCHHNDAVSLINEAIRNNISLPYVP